MDGRIPRLIIAGLSGDSGKTIVSLSLTAGLKNKGLRVSVFKKGPDYIDAAWLSWAADGVCRNLDTFLVSREDVYRRFTVSAGRGEIALIEGNRGVFDGRDAVGTHSTAGLAALLAAPVVLVVNVTKVTRTTAALINGCRAFAPEVDFAGVILNQVAGRRHQDVVTEAIERYCELPVVGVIPRLGGDDSLIPGRHLGLTTPAEFAARSELARRLAEIAGRYLNLEALEAIARRAPLMKRPSERKAVEPAAPVRIGYMKDAAFTFYYPENLESLTRRGARLIPISSLDDSSLPDIDALYIGGGFPEMMAEKLAGNRAMMASVKKAAVAGMPIYAECGGLIYLCRSLTWEDQRYPMAGVFPIDLRQFRKPIGHGYSVLRVDRKNPFYGDRAVIRGHEFHYSAPVAIPDKVTTCMQVETGHGVGNNRDGFLSRNVLACYTHVHADGEDQWARSLLRRAAEYRQRSRVDRKADLIGATAGELVTT